MSHLNSFFTLLSPFRLFDTENEETSRTIHLIALPVFLVLHTYFLYSSFRDTMALQVYQAILVAVLMLVSPPAIPFHQIYLENVISTIGTTSVMPLLRGSKAWKTIELTRMTEHADEREDSSARNFHFR